MYIEFNKEHFIITAFGKDIFFETIGEHCLNHFTDREAWEIGQFIWDIQPNYDTTDTCPDFFTYREEIFKALDKRRIVHPK